MRQIFAFALLLSLGLAPATAAEPRIGLVLSGGGARGAAHIGVLKVLQALRIPVHAIAATSMGALVGGAYASGVPLTEMERRVTAMDWGALFNDDPPRPTWPMRRKREAERPTWDFSIGQRDGTFRLPKGAIAGQKVQLFLADLVKNADGLTHYDQLPIPFRAVATNLENGQLKVFDHGPMAEALRASMSVPGLFAPLERADGIYVDGGLVRNLPVDIVRRMGVDVVIAVNLGSSYLKREQLGTILGITGQMIAILTEQNVERSLTELDPRRDLLIVPELGDISAADFNRAAEAIALGEAAARKAAPRLVRYQIAPELYAAWQARRLRGNRHDPTQVDEVRISGLENVNPTVFAPLRHNNARRPLDRRRLERDVQAVYGSGDFERISYRVEHQDDRGLIIVDAVEKGWGPGYLSFGLGLMNDYHGDSRFGLRGSYRQTWINALGADWTTDVTLGNAPDLYSELYQPLRVDRAGFVAPYLDLGSAPLHVYAGNDRIARYDMSHLRLGADLGTTLGTAAELRLGAYWGNRNLAVDTGSRVLPEGGLQDSGTRLRLLLDTLDSGYVPRHGHRLALDYQRPLRAFGADIEYHRLYASWQGAYSLGADSLVGTLRGGSGLGDIIPYYDQFALGGFLNLPGYANEQFRGSEMAYGSLVYYRRIAALTPPLGRGLYVGGSLEAGQLWGGDVFMGSAANDLALTPEELRYGASLFFGADTWLGPFYLGWGLSGTGNSSFYVLLGQP